MANEWTEADVLRVMQEEAVNGVVSIPKVRGRFNLTTRYKNVLFNMAVGMLAAKGVYRQAGPDRGYLIVTKPHMVGADGVADALLDVSVAARRLVSK